MASKTLFLQKTFSQLLARKKTAPTILPLSRGHLFFGGNHFILIFLALLCYKGYVSFGSGDNGQTAQILLKKDDVARL